MTTLAIEGLGKTYADGTEALRGINLLAHSGEIVALLGGSGCGKTTLLRLAAGLDQPSAGAIAIDGEPILGTHPAISAVFQEPRLLPWLRVTGNIGFGGRRLSREERQRRSEALLERIGLAEHGARWPKDLSGGQQQRVAIARALIGHPGILLLDEPFSALDAFTRASLHDLLLDLWQELRPTILMVTHDVDEAVFLADRVVVMRPRPGRVHETMAVGAAAAAQQAGGGVRPDAAQRAARDRPLAGGGTDCAAPRGHDLALGIERDPRRWHRRSGESRSQTTCAIRGGGIAGAVNRALRQRARSAEAASPERVNRALRQRARSAEAASPERWRDRPSAAGRAQAAAGVAALSVLLGSVCGECHEHDRSPSESTDAARLLPVLPRRCGGCRDGRIDAAPRVRRGQADRGAHACGGGDGADHHHAVARHDQRAAGLGRQHRRAAGRRWQAAGGCRHHRDAEQYRARADGTRRRSGHAAGQHALALRPRRRQCLDQLARRHDRCARQYQAAPGRGAARRGLGLRFSRLATGRDPVGRAERRSHDAGERHGCGACQL